MQAVRASVKPHVISPTTGEVLALEDAVASWIERDARGVILVSGKSGSGRTTAISHLGAVLPRKPHIRFFDHGELSPDEINAESIRDLLLIAAIHGGGMWDRPGMHLLADYRLAEWSFDDVIEYLMSRWPQSCASVISRLKLKDDRADGEFDSLDGRPGVWRVALDRMAQDETLDSPVEAVLQEIAAAAFAPERLAALQDLCLDLVTGKTSSKRVRMIAEFAGQIARLTAPPFIRLRLAADSVVAALRGSGPPLNLCPPLPAHVVRQVARLVDDPITDRLNAIIADRKADQFDASAVSILVALSSEWRPEENAKLKLERAVLDGVQWEGVDLTSTNLFRASLVNSVLAGADLMLAQMNSADLHSSDLREANLTSVGAGNANFAEADLRGVVAQNAFFMNATFEGANLDLAKLDKARFGGANLTRVSLRGAFLQEADLRSALVDDADFSGAVFDAAELDGVPLGRANITGASFYGTLLRRCDLEFIDPGSGMEFRAARLMEAHLTGAQLPNARMANADLRSTGLADINLEGADLRNVQLDNSTFHMGSSRSGLVDSPLASEGTRTGFYTDEYEEQHYRDPEEVRKANLRGADLRGASVQNTDFYLVDLRGAIYDEDQRRHFARCGAILD
ncbi:MAG: pentapeptide repeat-containing protein [Planctomycetales bacterium]